MLREETVFGPIHSRRLGNSLGINLLPTKGKICSFDCIYCECGWNKDGLGDSGLPSAADVRLALESRLITLSQPTEASRESVPSTPETPPTAARSKSTTGKSVPIDSITFSGDGEPTLNPDFTEIVDDTLRLRDRYCPGAKVSVLTNASRIHIPEVFEALRRVDNPILKIDAPTDELVAKIDRPAPGYSLGRAIEAMKAFDGDFILQTMFLRSKDFDSASPEVLNGWMDIVRELRPRQIMVYTIARPTPEEGLQKYTHAEMKAMVAPLIEEGFNITITE